MRRAALWILFVVIVIGGVAYAVHQNRQPGTLDGFAQCLKDKGATFYGAFWCPHCQNEKALFGKSERLLPYVECSTPDGNSQNEICNQKKIQSYPTWEFADGSRQTGEVTLATLGDKTGCPLPK